MVVRTRHKRQTILQPSGRRDERRALAKTLRGAVPHTNHGQWVPAEDRPDPIDVLQADDEGRLQNLLPIKYGRMVASPFAFLRGSAGVMAADLASSPSSGIYTQLCGDAHIANFGVFATPERLLVFDINDFDETLPGPFEWDLKRLAASVVVSGSENGFDDQFCREMAMKAVVTYAGVMRSLSELRTLDVWYYQIGVDAVQAIFDRSTIRARRKLREMLEKARSKTQERALAKLTTFVNGKRRFISAPPLVVRLRDLASGSGDDVQRVLDKGWADYVGNQDEDRRRLLERFRITDAALRVGGVGSVGTRCTVALLEGGADDDAIILQRKEAGKSVLEAHLGNSGHENPAQRVVHGQRLMQASSDIFLGWHMGGFNEAHYYWRQLHDMKGSFDIAAFHKGGFEAYVEACGGCLARAHGRGGDAASISGYVGRGGALADAIADFAVTYAHQTERDHQALKKAVASGRIAADAGVGRKRKGTGERWWLGHAAGKPPTPRR